MYCFRFKVFVDIDLMRPHYSNLHHVTIDSWFTGPKLSHELKQWNGMPFTCSCGFKKTHACPKDMIVNSQGPLMVGLYSDWRHVTVHVFSATGSFKFVTVTMKSYHIMFYMYITLRWMKYYQIKSYARILGKVHHYRLRKFTDFNLEWYVLKQTQGERLSKHLR